ncbi:MAG: lipopolysaccharide transport periplasmic protein LptA [Syntrophorhabdaceae bacterium]|nr:lipopolysaccharide transport periplasmic protein LptA [Syntrophorhabdaceae bacterium]
MKSTWLHLAIAMLMWFPSASFAAALTQNAGIRPIEVTADHLQAESGGTVTFKGNVVAVQGDVTMYADLLRAEYSRTTEMIERVEAEGEVRFLQEDKEVIAKKATLFNLEQRVVFSGGATMQQKGNTVQGETIIVYMNENRAEVKGSEEGGRVNAVINPKNIREATKP